MPFGTEAPLFSARLYLSNLPPDSVMLKIDFKNSFNFFRHDELMEAVDLHVLDIHPYMYTSFSSISTLYFGGSILNSADGVQQGDPLGLLLFCLAIHPVVAVTDVLS